MLSLSSTILQRFTPDKNNQQFRLHGTPFTLTYRLAGSKIGDVHSKGAVVYRNIRLDHFLEAKQLGLPLAQVTFERSLGERFEAGREEFRSNKGTLAMVTADQVIDSIEAELGL